MDGVARVWGVSVFQGIKDTTPVRHDWTWVQLTRALGTHHRRRGWDSKARVGTWTPAVYPDGAKRARANVESVSLLALDFDDGTPLGCARAWLDWPHIVHTSWSHTDRHHKWRIVLPLDEPVPAAEWPRAWAFALATWAERKRPGAGDPDGQCKDPSRMFFLPAWRDGQDSRCAWAWEPGAELLRLDWESIPKPPPPTKPSKRRPPPPICDTGSRDAEVRRRLRRDPSARRTMALQMGAQIQGNYARGVACPSCKCPTVWFLIEPTEMTTARCNRANNCGAFFRLWEL